MWKRQPLRFGPLSLGIKYDLVVPAVGCYKPADIYTQ